VNKVVIYIPCYNVEKTIKEVFSSFSAEILSRIEVILCVDNSSQDKTFSLLMDIQNKEPFGKKVVIIKNFENYGLGGSQKIAFQYFIDHQFSHFMIIHADLQGDNDKIARNFFEILDQKSDVDVVLASRFHPKANLSGYNICRRLGNQFFNGVTYLLTGHKISDAGTGIILFKTDVLRRISFVKLTNSFQFNPQLNILLYNIKGLKIQEIPLDWRDSKIGSNVQSIRYCWILLVILIKYFFCKLFFKKCDHIPFNDGAKDFKPVFEIIQKV